MIANVLPDGSSLLNWGLANDSLIYFSCAVPLLAVGPAFLFSAEEFSELDVDRVTFATTLCSFVDGLQ